MGRKVGPFRGGGRSPSNTMSPGLKPTSIPSGILIHPAVCPEQTWAKKWEAHWQSPKISGMPQSPNDVNQVL